MVGGGRKLTFPERVRSRTVCTAGWAGQKSVKKKKRGLVFSRATSFMRLFRFI